jgi:poly(A) polymerase/tRNA nucleotidyltransferase (CCA-adding enzyme)
VAALFHDVGKPQTREEKVNRNGNVKVTFYNHEVVSSKLAKRILKRLGFENRIVSEVTDLIYLHMYNYEPEEWTEAAVRRFIRKAKITNRQLKDLPNLPIFLLRRADRMANGHSLKAISYRQRLFEKRIEEVYNRSKVLDIKDLSIDGSTIMGKFNLKPGPTIGHILNYLLSIVIEDQKMNTEESLINATSDYLSKALK